MANTVMTNANMVVTREADPPGFFSNYASRTSFVLGGIQIGVGVLVVLFSVVVLASFGAYGVMSGIVGNLIFGVIFIVAGSMGIFAGKAKTTCPIVAFMVMSIIAAVYAAYVFFSFAVVAVTLGMVLSHREAFSNIVTPTIYVFVVVYLVEVIASIWSSALCCRSVCCGRRQTPGVVVAYAAPAGQVIMVNPVQTAQQQPLPAQCMGAPQYPAQEPTAPPPAGSQVSYAGPPPKY